MGVPKSLDYKDFMSKSTSANPTTWDDMYRFFGNQGEITAALVKSLLYQPDTAYSSGAIVYSPSLPAGTIAKCTLAGTTGSTEPAWPEAGSAVNDGTVRWLVENIRAANIPAAPDLTAYMKKDADSDLSMNNHKLVFPTGTISYGLVGGQRPALIIDASNSEGVNIKAPSVLVNESPIATKTDLSKYVKSINNLTPDSSGNVNISTSGGGTNITVDTVLSGTSNNAISNKAVYEALSGKLDKTGTATAAIKATQDGAGNVIATTYIKTINNLKPDDSGNINISTGGGSGSGESTSTQNTWTAKQNFQHLKFNFESFATSRISGTYDSPSKSVAAYNVTGALTLDMSTLAGMIGNGDTSIFTAYIASNGSYALSITNAGTLKYAGSAADLAITASGLLLNIFLTKNTSGVVTSIAQATKLS